MKPNQTNDRPTRPLALYLCCCSHPDAPCDEPCDACWQNAEEILGKLYTALKNWQRPEPDFLAITQSIVEERE